MRILIEGLVAFGVLGLVVLRHLDRGTKETSAASHARTIAIGAGVALVAGNALLVLTSSTVTGLLGAALFLLGVALLLRYLQLRRRLGPCSGEEAEEREPETETAP